MTAPVCLAGLFVDSDDSSDNEFHNEAMDAEINVGGDTFTIRERSFHPLNANAVWPGASVILSPRNTFGPATACQPNSLTVSTLQQLPHSSTITHAGLSRTQL